MELWEKIREIEEELKSTPYNKATEHHVGKLKAKLAKLKEKAEEAKSKSSGSRETGIRKQGDATVALVGFPSVGKSTLLNKLTNAESKVGFYSFTTVRAIPGMLEYKGARIQIIDAPGIIEEASSGRGRGKEVLSVIRNADLILIVVDVFTVDKIKVIKEELYRAGIRINQSKPKIKIKKKERGGIEISSPFKLNLSERTIKEVLNEYSLHNASVVIMEEELTVEKLIDALSRNRVYVKAITCINKIDLLSRQQLEQLDRRFPEAIKISAEKEINLDLLKEEIFRILELIRIYLKPPRGNADFQKPLIMRKGAKIADVCERIGISPEKVKYAVISGNSARHEKQRAGVEHELSDGDIVTLFT